MRLAFTSKFRLNKALFFVLVTALLAMQWSTTHIHLAGQHEHDNAKHQHEITAHQHSLASHHSDVIDIADNSLAHNDGSKVVELEQVCTQFHGKLADKATIPAVIAINYNEKTIISLGVIPEYSQGTYQSYHQYNPLHLRAPPVYI